MIDDGLYQLLTAAGSATHGVIADRMYPEVLPEKVVYPAATHQLVSNLPEYVLDDDDAVSYTARIQFEGWAKHKLQAQAVVQAILTDLKSFAGALPSGDDVARAWLENGPQVRFVSELELYLVQADWMVLYTPAA